MVRFAEEKDLTRVNELRKQVNDLHVAGRPDIFKSGFGEAMQNVAMAMLNGENSDIIVAERDGVICGMACVDYVRKAESPYTKARNFYHVQEIAVDEAFRRQGIAKEMLAFMKKDACQRGFAKIELDVWAFNASAIAFYEEAGFCETRRWLELTVSNL